MPPNMKQMNLFGGSPKELDLYKQLALRGQSGMQPRGGALAPFNHPEPTTIPGSGGRGLPGGGEQRRLPITGSGRWQEGQGRWGTQTTRPPTPPPPPAGPQKLLGVDSKKKKLLQQLTKGSKGAFGIGMGLLGVGMNVWMAYTVLDMMGLLGKKGTQDRALSAAVQQMVPGWEQQAGRASQYQGQRIESEQMQQLAAFAQAKQRGLEDTGTMLTRELDGLLAGKAGLLSRASLMSPETQRALQSTQAAGIL